MTLDEFGIDLFHAIRCIGGLLALQDQHNAAVHRNDAVAQAAVRARREPIIAELIQRMGKLTVEEQTEIAQRYPMVARL